MMIEERIAAYFDGWSRHDAAAVASTFADAGTYLDPISRMAVAPFDMEAVMWSVALFSLTSHLKLG